MLVFAVCNNNHMWMSRILWPYMIGRHDSIKTKLSCDLQSDYKSFIQRRVTCISFLKHAKKAPFVTNSWQHHWLGRELCSNKQSIYSWPLLTSITSRKNKKTLKISEKKSPDTKITMIWRRQYEVCPVHQEPLQLSPLVEGGGFATRVASQTGS